MLRLTLSWQIWTGAPPSASPKYAENKAGQYDEVKKEVGVCDKLSEFHDEISDLRFFLCLFLSFPPGVSGNPFSKTFGGMLACARVASRKWEKVWIPA